MHWQARQKSGQSLQGDTHILITVPTDLGNNFLPVVGIPLGLHLLLVEPGDDHTAQHIDINPVQAVLDCVIAEVYLERVLEVDDCVGDGLVQLLVALRLDLQHLQHGNQQ